MDTGLGLFTLHKIPRDRYVCAYAPTANLRESHLDGDYVIEMTFKDKILSGQNSLVVIQVAGQNILFYFLHVFEAGQC